MFSSENHGKITRIELRYPFFKAEFIQSDGEVLKITGGNFEAPARGVIDCREKYGQPNIATEFTIEKLGDNKIKITSTGASSKSSTQSNNSDLTLNLAAYLASENKKALDKEFKNQFSTYATGICGNKVKKGVVREAYGIIRAAIRSYGKSTPKKLIFKPVDPITGVRG